MAKATHDLFPPPYRIAFVETDFVTWLLDRIPADPRLEVPPGDDAAVLAELRATKELGLAVPGNIQIIGIDPLQEEGPATYRQPLSEMTACAVELALGHRLRSQKFEAVFVPGGSIREG